MADDLQRTYRDYSKRKRTAFRGSVKKAYSVVLHSYGLNDPTSSAEDDSDDMDENEEPTYVRIV